jgi:Flp pilus assembly protein TadG
VSTFRPDAAPAARPPRRPGQALIELALTIALLSLFLMAAIDAGLAYKSYQTLVNAAAEASSYLAQNPYAGDPPTKSSADANAIAAFRNEQSGTRVGTSSSANATIQIDMADSSQVSLGSGGVYGVSDSFNPAATRSACRVDRRNADDAGNPCYVVVRATIVYRPFLLTPFFGSAMTIRAVAVKPIVGYPL